MTNDESQSKEAIFKMLLPETAFISNFSMEIGGIMYYGVVKDKVQAQKEYDRAKEEGRTAGQVAAEQASRGFTPFTISVNVAAQSSVTFTLVYEELLQRRRGIYEHRTSIRPGQVISDLKIDVFLIEPAGILSLIVPKIQTTDSESVPDNEELTMATVTTSADDKSAHIYYYPSEQQQRAESEDGIMGTFLVRYDVTHHYDAGEIWVIGDYFVHFFAPPSSSNQLSVFPKNVVFVIDVSGSMSGTKLEQTKDAMQSILQDLRESDRFNILIFSDEVMQWKNNELVSATTSNVNTAKSYVEKLETIGGTNINDGLLEAIMLLRRNSNQAQRAAELIIMLTDGEPTSGVTNKKDIRKNVQGINEGQFAIFCLGFGAHVDFEFLEALSYENNGVARKIYEDADASIQLTGFFDEVALPLLLDVNINYLDNTVTMTTMSTFPNYFSGSEIVVAGKIADGNSIGEVKTAVTAVAVSENIELTADKNRNDVPAILTGTDAVDEFTQRLWVYLTINQLILESRAMEENSVEKNATIAKALAMSLEYNLVTELTSMIVIGPDLNNTGIDGDQLEWMEDGILFSRGAGVQPKLMAGSSGSAMYLLATVNLIISMIIYFIL
ncbi:inter-alpha-trypsin inhibitor heavy chain H3-like isoform X2 [Ptychodera flava]